MIALRRWIVPVVAAVALVAGAVVLWTSRPEPDFGWFAYTPQDPANWVFAVGGGQQAGVGLIVGGGLVLAGWVGYLIGRRTPRGDMGTDEGGRR